MKRAGIGPWGWVVAASLVLAHIALAVDGAARHSAVFDEVVYPTSGYAYLTTGDYRMNPEHPPFLKQWTALPWLGMHLSVRDAPGWAEGDQWRFGRAVLFEGGRDPESLLLRSRLMIAMLSAAAAIAVFLGTAWIVTRLGAARDARVAAVMALMLYSLDPLVVAHAGLATTDLGGASLYFLSALAILRALEGGERRWAILAGAVSGLALASKFTALLLVVVLPVAAWAASRTRSAPGSRLETPRMGPGRTALWIAVIGVAVLAASYGPAGPGPYAKGLAMLRHHGEVGHPSYALGRYGREGWWWYFPVAWAIKTPIPVIVFSLAGVGALAARWRRFPPGTIVLLLAPGVVVAAVAGSSLNLGVRHLLPAMPFLAMAGGIAGQQAWGNRFGRVAAVAAALWLAAGTLRNHPNEMAFANEAAGGPMRAWRLLSDSNVDWGQDLPALAHEVSSRPLRRLYLGYFGTADPAAYGLPKYHWIPSFGMAPKRSEDGPDPEGREWIAISVTNLLDVYGVTHRGHEWLRDRPFSAFPGNSIALFDVTDDGDAHREIARTALSYGEPEAAIAPLRRAVELNPEDGEAWADLARANAALARTSEALACCVEAERLLPGTRSVSELCAAIRADALP